MAIKYSALNLVPIREGDDERTAINDMVKLAQHLDELSYERYKDIGLLNTITLPT